VLFDLRNKMNLVPTQY